MKLSEINLDRELLIRFLRKRGQVFASFAVLIIFIGAVSWSFLFISQSLQKAFDVDQKKVQGEVPSIDLDAYERLKDTWKGFQGGKYVGSAGTNTNISSTNVNTENANAANNNAGNTNTSPANINANTNQ
ncbi:MAG TPA: hypothetical protein VJC11_01310 [Patescibacteria group bacterium]|nr:hypothetical protein [Patescibacteria group bacterium]